MAPKSTTTTSAKAAPSLFPHGWPLNADAWVGQMQFLANAGFRVIANDRRGHGRSDQPATDYDMDTFADDLAAVIDSLELEDAILVGHSMGGGDYIVPLKTTARRAAEILLNATLKVYKGAPHGFPITHRDRLNADLADFASR